MSRMPDNIESKYNHDNKFKWVDSQLEKFMDRQKELKSIINAIEDMVKKYPNNMELGKYVRRFIMNLEENKTYIYESPDGGKTVYRREFGDYETPRELVKNEDQMDLFRNK
tara:strand:+ start:167 stop:499 length:333 start_codon:yes stop_codon:yes gene_type:complete